MKMTSPLGKACYIWTGCLILAVSVALLRCDISEPYDFDKARQSQPEMIASIGIQLKTATIIVATAWMLELFTVVAVITSPKSGDKSIVPVVSGPSASTFFFWLDDAQIMLSIYTALTVVYGLMAHFESFGWVNSTCDNAL
jgi:hypothetical protein